MSKFSISINFNMKVHSILKTHFKQPFKQSESNLITILLKIFEHTSSRD